jgi:hypothetical protein
MIALQLAMKFNHKLYFFTLLLALTTSSCLEEVVYSNDNTYNRLNISGQFTNVATDQNIEIRKVSNFVQGNPVVGDPVIDAEVFVLENNTKKINFTYTANGIYTSKEIGKVGNSYKLVVKQGGQEYTSTSHIMQGNAKIESARLLPVKESILNTAGTIVTKNTCNVRISTKLNDGTKPMNVFYRFFSMYEFVEDDIRVAPLLRTCYIETRNDLGKIITLSGKDFANDKLEDYKIYSIDHDYKFYYKYLVRIEQFAVDSTTYNYWNKIQDLTKPDRSIFDAPPGSIINNITATNPENQPFGFFSVASKEEYYLNTNSAKLGFNAESYCRLPGVPFNQRRRECVDCRLFQNSTTTRPSFWPL